MSDVVQVIICSAISAVIVVAAIWRLLRIPERETPPYSSMGE